MRLGIAITTINRRDMVCAQIAELRRLTSCEFDLVICDDGSADGTQDAVRATGEVIIASVNRGVAWNKNRGIYYLMAARGCEVVILLDDDMLPTAPGWQERWVQGAMNFGHVNFIHPNMVKGLDAAACTAEAPGLSPALLGACMAFHRFAWSTVGYMDPRFGRYGHEHTEFTNRFVGNGYGGVVKSASGGTTTYYFVIGGGIEILPARTFSTAQDVAANGAIWAAILRENPGSYRAPWRDEIEKEDFLAEISLAVRAHKIMVPARALN